MKRILPVALIMLMIFALTGAATAEMPYGNDDEDSGYCRGMHHKKFSMHHGPGQFKGIGGITLKKLMQLDLSDAQKKNVANILAAYRDDSRKMADQLMDARKAFFDTLHSGKTDDESAVRHSFKQMSAVMENLVVQKTKIMAELKPVLTKDQLKDLMAHPMHKSDWKDKRKEMKKRLDVHRAMMDTWINTYADVANPDN